MYVIRAPESSNLAEASSLPARRQKKGPFNDVNMIFFACHPYPEHLPSIAIESVISSPSKQTNARAPSLKASNIHCSPILCPPRCFCSAVPDMHPILSPLLLLCCGKAALLLPIRQLRGSQSGPPLDVCMHQPWSLEILIFGSTYSRY